MSGFWALVGCGVALQLVWPDLTFPQKVLGEYEKPGILAGMDWLLDAGATKWLPLVLPTGLAARWLVPATAAPEWMRLNGAAAPVRHGPAASLPALHLTGRCLVVQAAAAFLLAGACHPAGMLIMDGLVEALMAAIAFVLRPGNRDPLLGNMRQCVYPLLDTAAARVVCARSPLLGVMVAFALMYAPSAASVEEDRLKASLHALKT